MRKILKTVLVLCILSVNAYGQNDVQKDSLLILKAFNKNDLVETKSEIVDSLENVVLRLSNKVGKIEENNLKSKKNDYESKSKLIKAQLNLLKELRETTETIISDRELMKTNTYISQINNPTANTLGFSFTCWKPIGQTFGLWVPFIKDRAGLSKFMNLCIKTF